MIVTAFTLAHRFVGIHELAGPALDHPLIQWWLSLCGMEFGVDDETPWCSAFVNGIAWELSLPRSKSAAARSWLKVGERVAPDQLLVGWDVVVLSRPPSSWSGHVGFFAGWEGDGRVRILGGNQSDGVCIASFDRARILGIQRLYPVAPHIA
jgi:uncharacterized protein (TIGR02594 family)